MKDKGILINKGNYSMETPERELLFESYRGEGWDEDYKIYRYNWVKYPNTKYLSEYPLLVDVELASICNLKCPMCYTITDEFKQKVNATLMDMNLYKKIVDEIAGKASALRLSLRGEPTLHPNLVECIQYAKEKGIGEVSFLTNGSMLTEEYFEKILKSGIDWITISVDGMEKTYEDIRKPITFEGTLSRIKNIKKIKEKYRKNRPVIKIQSIWPAIRENPEKFYNVFAPYVDLIAFNPLIDYLGNDCESDITYEEKFSCPQLYQRIVIGADGLVMMCSNDEDGTRIVGNANHDSIYEIWHGDKLNKVREAHKKENGFKRIEVCRKCYLPRATEESEIAIVNEREFTIKNYINRKQVVGK